MSTLTKGVATIWARLNAYWVPLEEIRAETWALGTRHRGRVLAGAQIEAAEPGITFRRAILLRAVIHRHKRSAAGKAEIARETT